MIAKKLNGDKLIKKSVYTEVETSKSHYKSKAALKSKEKNMYSKIKEFNLIQGN